MMKKSNLFLISGCILLIVAAIFIGFALNHPEMSFPWSNNITYIIYTIYGVIVLAMFILWLKKDK